MSAVAGDVSRTPSYGGDAVGRAPSGIHKAQQPEKVQNLSATKERSSKINLRIINIPIVRTSLVRAAVSDSRRRTKTMEDRSILNVEIPELLRRKIKSHSALRGTTVAEFVTELLQKSVTELEAQEARDR